MEKSHRIRNSFDLTSPSERPGEANLRTSGNPSKNKIIIQKMEYLHN